jgi:hypothetical protein
MTEITWISSSTCDQNGVCTDDFYSIPPSAPVENGFVIANSCFAPIKGDWSIQIAPAQPILDSSPDVFLPLLESAAVHGPHIPLILLGRGEWSATGRDEPPCCISRCVWAADKSNKNCMRGGFHLLKRTLTMLPGRPIHNAT